MLDPSIISQLQSVFSGITSAIELVVSPSHHPQQVELDEMLASIASTSPKISVRLSDNLSEVPSFTIYRDGKATGVNFRGIPGGHEFTSLIVAVLNVAGLGKMPDDGLKQRIMALKSGLKIRTYVSLSCENCPDIVQGLNRIAVINPGVEHTMIDGGMVPEEVETLGLQGVPAVYVGDELIHSGRGALADLLAKLEAKFADQDAAQVVRELGHFDVAVIGGGPAGASAAIYSARKGLKTVMIAERLGGQLQETKGIENLISVVYTEGPKLSANFEEHMRAYPIQILEHRRVRMISNDAVRQIELESGESLSCDALIVATGAKWRELNVPGEREYLGRGVAFCPHCDGPFYKGKKVAVIGGGNSGVEAAIDLAGIASDVVLVEYGDQLKADSVLIDKLKSLSNAKIITNAKTNEIVGDGSKVNTLVYQDRVSGEEKRLSLDGVFVQIGLLPNSALVKDVVEINKFGEIVIDPKGRTSATGIYAAGDVTTIPFKQIVIAMGEGAKVALTAFEDRMRQGVRHSL
jgi:alkyl hydroperoxide reductase subunit F